MIKSFDINDKEEKEESNYKDLINEYQFKLARTTYLILLTIILFLFLTHILKLYNFRTDNFTYFITILLVFILTLPLITNFKAFGVLEVKKDLRFMKK